MNSDLNSLNSTRRRSGKAPFLLVVILVIAILGAGAYFLFRDTAPPSIAIGPEATDISRKTELMVGASDTGSGIRSMEVVLKQGERSITLLSKEYPTAPVKVNEPIKLTKDVVKEGPFSITLTSRDKSFYPFGAAGVSSLERQFVLDDTAPKIYLDASTININQGGSGLLIYSLTEDPVKTGVQVGERFFPGYKQDDGKFHCLFSFPWDTAPAEFKPVVVADDRAGNKAKRGFTTNPRPKQFRRDKIRVPDTFLDRKYPEFERFYPDETDPLQRYLKVNKELRTKNRAALVKLGLETVPQMLWQGAFTRMKGANRAGFADYRDYIYKGKVIDNQTHLGIDIAANKNYPVPAGNNGAIILADYFGIYGNCVIIDHGLGLQSLYSHLSQISVQKGQTVSKGDIIGRTGVTGLAGGDHLHYGMYLSGTPVNPIEWWDNHWIADNILNKF